MKSGLARGRSILHENIRESCLYSILEAKGSEEKWWKYIELVRTDCDNLLSQACSKNVTEQLGESWDEL